MRARRSVILDVTVRLVFDTVLVLSLYLLFAGHNQPGGGFVGGLVASAAISLRYLAGGAHELRSVVRVRPWMLLGSGLVVAVGSALAPLLLGDAPLDQRAFEWDLPLLGHLKLTTATAFDTGVYVLVVGLILMVLDGLGEDAGEERDRPQEVAR